MLSIEKIYEYYLLHPQIQTDSRKIQHGDFFWALKGDNFDGNQFALQALNQGAAYAVVDDASLQSEKIFVVSDVLKTLQELALYHRQQLNIPVIAITGSNGKTTTKELIYAVLKSKFKTAATKGNLNNHIGIPLTLLSIPLDVEIAIVEMGANHQQEIASYCQYTQPNYGIITNCGKAHIGLFGGEEGVKKAKGELFDFLKTSNNSVAFVATDYPYLNVMSAGIQTVFSYGTNSAASVKGQIINNNPFLTIQITTPSQQFEIKSKLVGAYNLMNLLCAVTVGLQFKIGILQIVESIENYIPSNSRSQWLQHKGNQIILDAYNANPSSMEEAIKNFGTLKLTTKIIFLGEMKELGEASKHEHQEVIHLLEQYEWAKVILVGKGFGECKHGYQYFENNTLAKEWFEQQNIKGANVLIKGSRATRMEKLIEIV